MAIKPVTFSVPLVTLTLFLSCLSLPFNAQAVPVIFSDEMLFDQALASMPPSSPSPASAYLDFEAIAPFGARVGGGVSSYSLPGIELSAPLPAIKVLSKKYSGARNTTPGGRNYLSIDTDLRRQGTITNFDFDTALQAIGFYLIDQDASDAVITVDGIDYTMPEVNDGEAVFFGLLFSEPSALAMRLQIDSGKDAQIAIDDLRFSDWPTSAATQTVNEPNTTGLLLISVLFWGFRRVFLSTRRRLR